MKNSLASSALLSIALPFAGCAIKPAKQPRVEMPSLFLGNEILYTLPWENVVAETRPDTAGTYCTTFYLLSKGAAIQTISDCSEETQENISGKGIENARDPKEEAEIIAGNIAEREKTATTIGCYLSDSTLENKSRLPLHARKFYRNFCLD